MIYLNTINIFYSKLVKVLQEVSNAAKDLPLQGINRVLEVVEVTISTQRGHRAFTVAINCNYR